MTLDLINFVPNTKIKASEVNTNFSLLNDELSTTQGTVEQLNSTVTTGTVPVGAVFWFAGSSVPDGYLLCDGSAVSRSTYATLYTRIGTTYGVGDGTTTFNVPKLTDRRYIQGYTTVGEVIEGKLPDHMHKVSATTGGAGGHKHTFTARNSTLTTAPASGSVMNCDSGIYETSPVDDHTHTINADTGLVYNNSNYGLNEYIRPQSLTLLPCIKAIN